MCLVLHARAQANMVAPESVRRQAAMVEPQRLLPWLVRGHENFRSC